MVSYDHEPIFATGSLLGISDVPGMLKLMDEIEVQGLDVMSAGVALAWATEAMQTGLIAPAIRTGCSWNLAAPKLYPGGQTHRQPADRVLPRAGARRGPRRLGLRRLGVRPDLRQRTRCPATTPVLAATWAT
jgi:hypothetical protein